MDSKASKNAKSAKEERTIDPSLERVSYEVIGAAIEVHRELGPGYLESVYEEAMAMELADRGIAFQQQLYITLRFKGREMKKKHRLDFLVDGRLILELKAVAEVEPLFKKTVTSYLKATEQDLGLIINFNVAMLKDGITRVIRPLP